MGGPPDRNYMEGVPVKDALFVAHGGSATFQQDPLIVVPGGDFENVSGDRFLDWTFQDNEGKSIFADHPTAGVAARRPLLVHGGKTSLRMENIGAGHPAGNCRLSQKLTLKPFRQYHITVWTKTEDLRPAEAEVKVLTPDSGRSVSFQTFHIRQTEDWTRHDLAFNTLRNSDVMLYMGVWGGRTGKLWWDDLSIEEIGLVNVLRRPGCPVSVRGENGMAYEEGRDFEGIRDPNLHPWQAYHEMPTIRLTADSRITEGERLRVSYYHPLIVYEDRLNGCLSEPKILEWWREEVKQADAMFHPPAFFMSHDEIRVIELVRAL